MIKNHYFRQDDMTFPRQAEFSDCKIIFPYGVGEAVEFDDKVVVAMNVPKPENTRNIWCYSKPGMGSNEGKLLWKVEPPINHRGEPWERPYYSLRWSEKLNALYAGSDSFGYTIELETGKIKLVASGLR